MAGDYWGLGKTTNTHAYGFDDNKGEDGVPTLVLMISLAVAMRILYVCTAQLSPFCWLNALSPKFSRLMLCIPSPLCSLLPQPTIPCKCKCNSFLSMLCNGHAASSEWYKIVPKIPPKRKAKFVYEGFQVIPAKGLESFVAWATSTVHPSPLRLR